MLLRTHLIIANYILTRASLLCTEWPVIKRNPNSLWSSPLILNFETGKHSHTNISTAMEAIVLYPTPAIGHLIPMVELGKLIRTHIPPFTHHPHTHCPCTLQCWFHISIHSLCLCHQSLHDLSQSPQCYSSSHHVSPP